MNEKREDAMTPTNPESTEPEKVSAIELLPCPFCTSTEVSVREGYQFYVECDRCDSIGPVRNSRRGAGESWNRRVPLVSPTPEPQPIACPKCGATENVFGLPLRHQLGTFMCGWTPIGACADSPVDCLCHTKPADKPGPGCPFSMTLCKPGALCIKCVQREGRPEPADKPVSEPEWKVGDAVIYEFGKTRATATIEALDDRGLPYVLLLFDDEDSFYTHVKYLRRVSTEPEPTPCPIPLDGPSAMHSEMAENGDLDEHIAERHHSSPAPTVEHTCGRSGCKHSLEQHSGHTTRVGAVPSTHCSAGCGCKEYLPPNVPTGELSGERAMELATLFHETYERLAPLFGYETRAETRTFDPTSANGRLMIAVCGEIDAAQLATIRQHEETIARLRPFESGKHEDERAKATAELLLENIRRNPDDEHATSYATEYGYMVDEWITDNRALRSNLADRDRTIAELKEQQRRYEATIERLNDEANDLSLENGTLNGCLAAADRKNGELLREIEALTEVSAKALNAADDRAEAAEYHIADLRATIQWVIDQCEAEVANRDAIGGSALIRQGRLDFAAELLPRLRKSLEGSNEEVNRG